MEEAMEKAYTLEENLCRLYSSGFVSRNVHNANAKKTHPVSKWTKWTGLNRKRLQTNNEHSLSEKGKPKLP